MITQTATLRPRPRRRSRRRRSLVLRRLALLPSRLVLSLALLAASGRPVLLLASQRLKLVDGTDRPMSGPVPLLLLLLVNGVLRMLRTANGRARLPAIRSKPNKRTESRSRPTSTTDPITKCGELHHYNKLITATI